MGGKTAIAAGLVMGTVAGAALLGGVVLFAPGLPPLPTIAPATPDVTASAPASPSASASPSSPAPAEASPGPAGGSPGASGSLRPSGSVSPSAPGGDALFGVGEPAPPLVVPTTDGGEVDLASLRGKPVWVNFMGSYCPPCQDELPLMAGFAARYADTGLVVLPVDVEEDAATAKGFTDALGVTFPVGLDADGSAQAEWRAIALPVHFWVDVDGIVRDGALGGIGPDIMAHGLQSILPGLTVTP
jgi:thiol-disulfide isomerase/thioredoxin